MNDRGTSRSWFLVFNNPEEILTYETDSDGNYVLDKNNDRIVKHREPSEFSGLEPEEICNKVLDLWCTSETRTGAASFCITKKGLRHLHIIFQDVVPVRFTAVKALLPRAHIEAQRGSKKQAEDYINKVGSWAEKGETVVCIVYRGELTSVQGKRTDLASVVDFINEGLSPKEIFERDIKYLKNADFIKSAYFFKRDRETPAFRHVTVYYHCGLSGSGKSYTYTKLLECAPNDVCFVMQYGNGFLDHYMGERILFMDEFRGEIPFTHLLTLLDDYKGYFHGRNKDVLRLWDEVHITSVLPPEELYNKMISSFDKYEAFDQLRRRIDYVVYHWKEDTGNDTVYRSNFVKMEDYSSYDMFVLTARSQPDENGFCKVDDDGIQVVMEIFGK